MNLSQIRTKIPEELYNTLSESIKKLRPAQEKSLKAGLLDGRNLLVCSPTASGKTLIAELAVISNILNNIGKAIYIVPLKALASEKYSEFKTKYPYVKVAMSIGDTDSSERRLENYDLIITTSEKLDSLLRHHAPWLRDVKTIVIDEIHLLNDPGRGPTLEILITILRKMLAKVQFISLSATIGNAKELADWLQATLVSDDFRPVELKKGIYLKGKIDF